MNKTPGKVFFHHFRLPFIVLIAQIAVLLCEVPCRAYTKHEVFFEKTERELHIYKIYGEEPGKTLLIIGGIQGNEPGGYLAADLYVEMSLRKGNLFVVPRANFQSILKNVRGVNGDMNRKFADIHQLDNDRLIIEKLKQLMKESDFVLNLHDGSGFFSSTWISDRRNPMRYGQSIIADCDTFHSKKYNADISLGDTARRICRRVNKSIRTTAHHFHFNNHNTASKRSQHKEQRGSATYFALSQYEIPAFGIETSKDIASPLQRVRYQTIVINAFMDELGIIPEHPSIALPDPKLNYVVIEVNNKTPVVVLDGRTLKLAEGDTFSVIHADANYRRGLTANIIGLGTLNDFDRHFTITRPARIVIKKDNLRCGEVFIDITGDDSQSFTSKECRVRYLLIRLGNNKIALSPGECLRIQKGSVIELHELVTQPTNAEGLQVNFKGFVGNSRYNDGEDRGYRIDTGKSLIERFSCSGKGRKYPIIVKHRGRRKAVFYISMMKSGMQDAVFSTLGK